MRPLLCGDSVPLFPMLLKRRFASPFWRSSSVYCVFLKSLQSWHLFVLHGRDLSFGNKDCLLEPRLVNTLGTQAKNNHFGIRNGECDPPHPSVNVLLIWLSGFWNKNSRSKWDHPCSPPTICQVVCGLLEWQTIMFTCLFSSCIRPFAWTETQNAVFLALWVLMGPSCGCCQPLYWTQKTVPKLHLRIPNWTEAILTPPFLPPLPSAPAHHLSASLWLRSQGKDCLLTLSLLFCTQLVLFLSFK